MVTLHPVDGIRLGTTCTGVELRRRDLVVMDIGPGADCVALFTRNAFCAAPVIVARRHLSQAAPRLLVINAGNANAGMGERGIGDAQEICTSLAKLHGCAINEVLPFSTGVVGEPLPVAVIRAALPNAYANLSSSGWQDAAHGILTTDTVAKAVSRKIDIGGCEIAITGIAKGAGMIRPDMATLLAFITTDVKISRPLLQCCLERAVASSFNCITVDGDTSTNDACVLIATGRSELAPITAQTEIWEQFSEALTGICEQLARAIVRDGEGATKLITIEICEGASERECRDVAYTIAHSPLVKTAFFASDPNWGRILAAVGRAGLDDMDIGALSIYLDDVCIVSGGSRDAGYEEQMGQAVMDRDEITIRVDLGRGDNRARIWTCDLSDEYVRINAEYRT